jgi:hypothetical protein
MIGEHSPVTALKVRREMCVRRAVFMAPLPVVIDDQRFYAWYSTSLTTFAVSYVNVTALSY